jgi:hypothetical protein
LRNKKQNKIDTIDFLSYLGMFFVLLMGSGLIKIPDYTLWFFGIKVGINVAILTIALSAWWRAKKNNEPPIAYLKLALFIPFTADFNIHYTFIFLTIILFNKKLLLPWKSPLKPIYLLFILGFISYVVNQFIEFNPLSFPIFVGYFFLTFIFFGLFYKYAKEIEFRLLKQYFLNIVMIMIVITIAQIIFLPDVYPDFWHGGTGDAHYAGLFLSIAFILIISKLLEKKSGKVFNFSEIIITVLTLPILFFIDSKTIFIFTLVVFLVIIFIRIEKAVNKIAFVSSIICLILLWYNFSDRKLPISILSLKYNVYYINEYTDHYTSTDKFHLLKEAELTFKNDPIVALIGGGPGTFLSRTALFKKIIVTRIDEKLKNSYLNKFTKIIQSSFKPADSWVKIKYAGINFEKRPYASMVDWRSSLINLFFEFGFIGVLLYSSFIFILIKKGIRLYKKDKRNGFLLITFTTLVMMLFYLSYWGESVKFGISVYSFLGYLFTIDNNKL